jgi:ABC-type transport system involved in multi-copper enzyme maturation permease subunit
MVPALKSEFRKLLTVRSTYVVTGVAILLASLFTYLGTSQTYEEVPQSSQQNSQTQQTAADTGQPAKQAKHDVQVRPVDNLPKEKLLMNIQDGMVPIAILLAAIVILLMGHEFRYNTIAYTLTASNSRTKVLLSKTIVSIVYVTIASMLVYFATIAATYIAVSIKGLYLPPQDLDWLYITARYLGYMVGISLLGLGIITLTRNLIASIVALFILPLLEGITAGIFQSQNIEVSKYLPYTALSRVGDIVNTGDLTVQTESMPITVPWAVTVSLIYIAGILIIGWYLFLRRDAA